MADVLDVLTLNEAKATLDIALSDTARDDRLASYVTTVSRRLDEAVGPIVQRAVTELHDGGRSSVRLRRRPVASVTSVTEFDDATPTVLAQEDEETHYEEGFLLDHYEQDPALYDATVYRRDDGADALFPVGRQNVRVLYVAGRYATTATVDARFKQAAGLMLRNLWKQEEQSATSFGEFTVPTASFPTFGIPNAVKELLRDVWQDDLRGFA